MSRAKLIKSVTTLKRSQITIADDRLRNPDPATVGVLVKSVEEHGLLQPVIVRRLPKGVFELIDGGHRMGALALLKIEDVPVRCYEGPAPAIRLIEIDTTLAAADLTDLDRAVFLAARRREYLSEHPETAQGKGRWDKTAETAVLPFVRLASQQTGLNEDRVFKLARVGDELTKEMTAKLRSAPNRVTLNDLLELSKADPDARPAAVDAFAAGEVKKLAAALSPPTKQPVKDPLEQAFAKLKEAWSRAPKKAKRRFVETYGDQLTALLPDGGDA